MASSPPRGSRRSTGTSRRGEVRYIVDDSGSTVLFDRPRARGHRPRRRPTARRSLVAGDELDGVLAAASDEPFDARRPGRRLHALHERHDGPAQGRASAPRQSSIAAALNDRCRRRDAARARRRRPAPRDRPAVPRRAARASRSSTSTTARAIVIMPNWDPAETLRLIEEHGVHNTHLVPTCSCGCCACPTTCARRSTPRRCTWCCTAPRRSRRRSSRR